MATPSETSNHEMCMTSCHKKSPLVWEQDWHSISHKAVYMAGLRAAREQGCETCSFLCGVLARYKGVPISQLIGAVKIDFFSISWRIPRPSQQDVALGQAQDKVGVFELTVAELDFWKLDAELVRLELFTTSDVPCHPSWIVSENGHYPPGRILPKTTDSEETLAQVRKWLSDCTATHNRCGSGAVTELPTRILDLSRDNVTGAVRLVETDEASMKFARYACLSYCWGGELAETAVASTVRLSSMKEGIWIKDLPQTFQDAVHITKRLGVRYLWIDSMCILQDDESDWDRESRKMASVYQGAFITIGATCSQNSDAGFIRSSSPAYTSSLASLKCQAVDGRFFDLYVRERVPHFADSKISTHPMLKRAWIYQERILSPRFLHFGQEELVWECNEYTSCQCLSLPNSAEVLFDYYWHPETKQEYSKGIHSTHIGDLTACWRGVVGTYNQLALSFERDRLRAVAGIADQISTAGSKLTQGGPGLGRYIEGLWESSILENLCWKISSLNTTARRPDNAEWRAPTWSWASVQDSSATIDLQYSINKTKEKFAEVLKFGYTHYSPACQKYVQYNYIRLKLYSTREITLDKKCNEYNDLTWWLMEPNEGEVSVGINPDYDWDNAADDGHISVGSKVTCGLLLSSLDDGGTCVGVGLLLVPVDMEHELYRRIGCFCLWMQDWQDWCSQTQKQMIVSLV